MQRGVNVNCQLSNHENSTPLHIAAYENHAQIVDLLLNSGADPTITNNYGNTAEMEDKTGRIKVFRKQRRKYPTWWDMDIDRIGTNYGQAHLIPINPDTDVFKTISKAFYDTSKSHQHYGQFYPNIKIIEIHGIQNKELFDLYQSHKRILKQRFCGDEDKINERNLWHGTENIQDIIATGFRRDFNHRGAIGGGTYFAVDAAYSVMYSSSEDQNGYQKMLLCSVLCGESILGAENYTLTNWPKKSDGAEYDSLSHENNDRYVILRDNRACPMFIVTFKKYSNDDKWSCSQCTFLNWNGDTVCSVCGAAKA